MLSFHDALAESQTAQVDADLEASSKKRKWEEPFPKEFSIDHHTNLEKRKSLFDIELPLNTPFSSNHRWHQYLTIQSGQIHLCDTRVNGTTAEEPKSVSRGSPEPPPSNLMTLDLELNLTSESQRKNEDDSINKQNYCGSIGSLSDAEPNKCKNDSDSASWLSLDGDHKEMVATVCMRCHMLVMLCKSSPACPNCKFMHPPDQNPSNFLKRRCSLFC